MKVYFAFHAESWNTWIFVDKTGKMTREQVKKEVADNTSPGGVGDVSEYKIIELDDMSDGLFSAYIRKSNASHKHGEMNLAFVDRGPIIDLPENGWV